MKNLDKHITELDRLMKTKGYDGFFLSAWGYPGRLAESLTAFCRSYLKESVYGLTFPPALTTYSYWGGDQKESVQCHFKLDYRETEGFRVKSVELESQNRYGFTDNKKTVAVISDGDNPTRQQSQAWGIKPEISKTNKNSKGLKF